jgi:hypothetical protein
MMLEKINPHLSNEPADEVGFGWWTTWAWLGLTLGNLMLFVKLEGDVGFALVIAIVNTIFMILILRYNKYAFLIATVISINPILWIINGIYLKNRWKHPKVNNGVDLREQPQISIFNNIKETADKVQERVHEYRVQKTAEDEAIRATVKKSLQDSDDTNDLQELINKAVAKGDTETAQALLSILNNKK